MKKETITPQIIEELIGHNVFDKGEVSDILNGVGEETLGALQATIDNLGSSEDPESSCYQLMKLFEFHKGKGGSDTKGEFVYYESVGTVKYLNESDVGTSRKFTYKGKSYTIDFDKQGSSYYCKDSNDVGYILPDGLYKLLKQSSKSTYNESILGRKGVSESGVIGDAKWGLISIDIEEQGDMISLEEFNS